LPPPPKRPAIPEISDPSPPMFPKLPLSAFAKPPDAAPVSSLLQPLPLADVEVVRVLDGAPKRIDIGVILSFMPAALVSDGRPSLGALDEIPPADSGAVRFVTVVLPPFSRQPLDRDNCESKPPILFLFAMLTFPSPFLLQHEDGIGTLRIHCENAPSACFLPQPKLFQKAQAIGRYDRLRTLNGCELATHPDWPCRRRSSKTAPGAVSEFCQAALPARIAFPRGCWRKLEMECD